MSPAEKRRQARAQWKVERFALGEEPSDADAQRALDPSARVALVWSLTLDAWAMRGAPLPEYERAHMPGAIVRGRPSRT